MQKFIDNWSASLLEPASASAVSLSVEPAKAALLTGLGSGNFYRLTLVEVDASGTEIDWDVVQVTDVAGGALTVIRADTARDWPAGTLIEARLTADGLRELVDQIAGALSAISEKQDVLVSGENLKTLNGLSLLGGGDLAVLGGGGGAPAPVVLELLAAAVPVPAAVGQLMTCYTSVWIAINTDSAWGWKRIGKPAVAYGLSASATAYSPGATNTAVAGLYAEIYVGPVTAGATVHNSIRLPLLPQGVSLLDPMLIGVVDLSGKSASHALRLYDDDYTATDIWLNCRDGIDVQAVRQPGYVELTTTEDVLYEINISHYDDGTLAEIGIDAVRNPVRVPTYGLGSMAG